MGAILTEADLWHAMAPIVALAAIALFLIGVGSR
jgi:hypothetical protein